MGPGYLLQPAKEICLPLQFEENLHMLHKFDTIAQYHVVDQFSSILNELCLMFCQALILSKWYMMMHAVFATQLWTD